MSPIVLPGQTLELAYPAHNRFDVPLEFVDRRIRIYAVKDFAAGLSARYIIRRPMVRRGRLLLYSIDLETQARRKFWYESRHGARLMEYRLGLYDPSAPGQLVDWVDRIYGPTPQEQLRMRRAAIRWLELVNEYGDVGLKLAAYPWEN